MNNAYYLFSGDNIIVDGVVMRQPKVWEFLKFDTFSIEDLIEPFYAFIDLLELDEIQKSKYKNLDLIFHDHLRCIEENNEPESRLLALKSSLIYLCATNHVDFDITKETITINNSAVITRDNFDELQNAVLYMFNRNKPEKESIEGSDFQRKKILEMQEKRMRHMKKDQMQLHDIMKIVMFGGKNFIPYGDVMQFTYLQLMDAYTSILTVSGYSEYLMYKTSEKFEIKEEQTHWIKSLKLS